MNSRPLAAVNAPDFTSIDARQAPDSAAATRAHAGSAPPGARPCTRRARWRRQADQAKLSRVTLRSWSWLLVAAFEDAPRLTHGGRRTGRGKKPTSHAVVAEMDDGPGRAEEAAGDPRVDTLSLRMIRERASVREGGTAAHERSCEVLPRRSRTQENGGPVGDKCRSRRGRRLPVSTACRPDPPEGRLAETAGADATMANVTGAERHRELASYGSRQNTMVASNSPIGRSVRTRVVGRSGMWMPLDTGNSTKSVADMGPGSEIVVGRRDSARVPAHQPDRRTRVVRSGTAPIERRSSTRRGAPDMS